MDAPAQLPASELEFQNGNRATSVHADAGTSSAQVLASLGLELARPVILLIGGANSLDDAIKPRLFQLLGRGVARAAVEIGEAEDGAAGNSAWVMDGGTRSGVMEQMGLAIADEGRKTPLLGVAPEAMVLSPGQAAPPDAGARAPLDPNHSHFVLTAGSAFGDESDTLFRIVEAVTAPVVAVLVGGGVVAANEAVRVVRLRRPLIVVEGSGGLADQIVEASHARSTATPPPPIPNPQLAEIIEDGRVCVFARDDTARELRQVLLRFLSDKPKDALLNEAWREFATFDKNAGQQQTAFHTLQDAVLWVAVATTALALLHKAVLNPPTFADTSLPVLRSPEWLSSLRASLATASGGGRPPIDWLRWPILALPIVTAVLVAAGNRFRPGNRWIFLRAAAEGIKREIFFYRTRAGAYGDNSGTTETAEETLAAKLADIKLKLARTEVNRLGMDGYDGEIPPKHVLATGTATRKDATGENVSASSPAGVAPEADDGLAFLKPNQYVVFRLQDQLAYYRKTTRRLDRQLTLYQIYIFAFGAVGSLLVAVGLDLWTALTSGLVATFTGILAYQQTENTLIKYNLSKADLEKILDWWTALDSEDKKDQANIDRLVTNTETALQGELTGWVQQMQDTLADLSQQAGQQGGQGRGQAQGQPVQPPPGDQPKLPAPGGQPEQPAPGGQPEQPAPGDQPEQPARGDQPEQPAPGGQPEQPSPGGQPGQPAPGSQPEQPVPGAQSVQPAPGEQPGEPAPGAQPAQPPPGDQPGQPPPDGQPGQLPAGGRTEQPAPGDQPEQPAAPGEDPPPQPNASQVQPHET
jgi:hypothetical protein